jgi:ribosomal protein L12E/L44/L45/RPP1/RPP2
VGAGGRSFRRGGEIAVVRSRELHDALRGLADEVSELLTGELEGGAELSFEVLDAHEGDPPGTPRRRGPVLYRYRPLTGRFIAERWTRARELDSYVRALHALGPGAGPYLRHRGLRGSGPDDALRDLMERLFDDATTFSVPEERFERIHAEIDATLEGSTVTATVVALLHGVRISAPRVEVGEGVALVRRASLADPPFALEGTGQAAESTAQGEEEEEEDDSDRGGSPLDVFCVLERELPLDSRLPVDEARIRFRRILTALRLCGAGGTALGPLAWARADRGAWHPVALGISARARPESWELRHSDEAELRDLLEILSLSRHSAGVGWALSRFEMGCERSLETEALTDYLLGLASLLSEPSSFSEGALAARLAAICAPEDERDSAVERITRAIALERRLAYGAGDGGAALALDSPRALVREVEQYLRALLRDVLCGYLDEDLRAMADEILDEAKPPESKADEIRVRDTRQAADEDTAELDVPAVTPSIDWESV